MADEFNIGRFTVSQPNEANQTEKGENFFGTVVKRSVSDSSSINLLIITGSIQPATLTTVSIGGASTGFIFEGTLVSANGTQLDVWNSNRESAATELLTWFDGPTITNDGQQLAEALLQAGEKEKGITSTDQNNRVILKANTNYLIRVTNNSGGTIDISVVIDFNEPSS